QLAHEAAPEAARVRAVPATTAEDAGGVRVLMVPAAADDETGRLPFEQLIPPTDMLETVAAYLDRRRTIGARVVVEPPAYQGVTVVAVLRPRSWVDPARLQTAATRELFHYLHPLSGGPDGDGWPFGRPVHMGEIFSVLQALHGTELVEDVRLFAADPITGERGQSTQRIEVAENALVFSYEHQVRVLERT
ncbi:MAG TPA: baseplate J/gp47 family protein, partial [Acidimicrobiales bacterium]|nr:baseplate J/gp47 family protein [Acidimicrobiales bacterium]